MGVYVHIPFCARKCYYCDFHSIVVGDPASFREVANNYLLSVRREALIYRSELGSQALSSLFLGGGTPSLVPAQALADLISFLLDALPFDSEPEVTIEANPHSLTDQGVALLREAGVNRVSLGVQAFQNSLLRSLGRLHQAHDVTTSVQLLKNNGINNISLDLMYGLPGQTIQNWRESLERAVDLEPQHLSCYSLILEEGTPFASWEAKGLLDLPTDDQQAEMYELARRLLRQAGYEHYEISNFAKSGYQSTHNLLYWENLPFVGLGSGATGYLRGQRYTNVANVGQYIESLAQGERPIAQVDQVSLEQEMEETMMVGMRLLRGVDEREFTARFGQSFFRIFGEEIQELLKRGLVEYVEGFLRVTERGLYLENQVSAAFLK
jgi:oxygen-independent coproporphyrinogen-3 oxidase